jgi:glycosyltransferase involved in cell wall biosynthesis
MRLVIDARESGTSTGRYVDKLIEYLHKLQPDFEVMVLSKPNQLNFIKTMAPEFEVVPSNFKEFTVAEQTGLLRQLNNLQADLVHFSMTQQPVLYKGRRLTTIHDLTTIRYDNPAKNPLVFKAKQQVYKQVIKQVAKNSARIITPSEFVKNDVVQFTNTNPAKVTVTHEAAERMNAPAKPYPRLADKRFIMYVGRATPHKNLARLVEAYAVLRAKYPDLYLVLAGKTDSNYKRVGALVSAKRLADRVIFTDYIDEGELRWLYQNTTAYVFPSLSEGFGLPGLEAMVHGAPVVSSNATCLPEIYGEAAHYFDPLVTYDIAQKISNVLSSPHLRNQLIKKGHSQAAKYSWPKMAAQTLQIYNQLLINKNT